MEKLTRSKVIECQQILAENGIEPDETATVLQAIGYVLLDTELENLLDWNFELKEVK